jgi:hypothetical protein
MTSKDGSTSGEEITKEQQEGAIWTISTWQVMARRKQAEATMIVATTF